MADSRSAARVGGWSLIAAAVGFMAVFGYLAARFDYPDVLDGAAADVLPRLLALGDTGRAVWVVYAFLPLLLIPSAVGAYAVLHDVMPTTMRAALVFGPAVSLIADVDNYVLPLWLIALGVVLLRWRDAASPDQ